MPRAAEKYLFLVSSSYGHLFPAIRLAQALQRAGADVLFVTAREYQVLLDTQGIRCVAYPSQGHPFLSTHVWFDPAVAQQAFDVIWSVAQAFEPDRIVCTPLVTQAFVLSELRGTPLVVLGYCEYLFPGVGEVASPKQWRIESLTGHYNNLRERLGLPPVAPDPARSPMIGDRHLIRSVPEFTDPDGLPAQAAYVGALLWDPPHVNHDLDRFLDTARADGLPVFFVQIGRLFAEWEKWTQLVRLLGRMPARFVVDLGRSDYMDEHTDFPDNFHLHPFVPLGPIRDAVSGVICSGQTTSVVSALFHAKPVLGVPTSGDGREVTDRMQRQGVGTGIVCEEDLTPEAVMGFIDAAVAGHFDRKLLDLQACFHAYENDAHLLTKVMS